MITLSTRLVSADDRSKLNTFCEKEVKIVEFHDHIWNHHEKYIQMRTNMPGNCLEICEILRILKNKTILYGW